MTLQQKDSTRYGLTLADGSSFTVEAGDEKSSEAVAKLAEAMRLECGENGGFMIKVVSSDKTMKEATADSSKRHSDDTCVLLPYAGETALVSRMMDIGRSLAFIIMKQGGLFLHGALAQYKGCGIILAGHSGAGKSTASSRLKHPWLSLSDDECLVVRDLSGKYRAHPWPTWSRLMENGTGDRWDVNRGIPLKAIFFLEQAAADIVETLNPAQASSLLVNSVQQTHYSNQNGSPGDIRTSHLYNMVSSDSLSREIPAYMLKISLTGKFWEKIEERIAQQPEGIPGAKTDLIPVVYAGPSMNPTLRQGDLLDVRPYGNSPVRKGDVIYFKSPEGRAVVHRVCAVTGEGIRTRGDNNSEEDPYLLGIEDITGQVVSAQRSSGKRPVHGGRRGRLVMRINTMMQKLRKMNVLMFAGLYRKAAGWGILNDKLPSKFKPKVVSFSKSLYQDHFKLIMNKKEVGYFDDEQNVWRIRAPYRLFVNDALLPRPENKYSPLRRMHKTAAEEQHARGLD